MNASVPARPPLFLGSSEPLPLARNWNIVFSEGNDQSSRPVAAMSVVTQTGIQGVCEDGRFYKNGKMLTLTRSLCEGPFGS